MINCYAEFRGEKNNAKGRRGKRKGAQKNRHLALVVLCEKSLWLFAIEGAFCQAWF